MKNLYLLFPQWQGSGNSYDLYHGAKFLQSKLRGDFSFVEIDVSLSQELTLQKNILGYEEIKKQLNSAAAMIERENPEKIFTIGGDCGVELAPVSYLNRMYNNNLGVIWFDAHGDLNTPESSPSKKFHGMPLRTLLGEGDEILKNSIFSKLTPQQVFLAGIRDLDRPEEEYVSSNNITTFSIGNLLNEGALLAETISKKGFKKIYIHIDLDVIDPDELPDVKCPSPQGLPVQRLLELIQLLKKHFFVVGASVVEFKPQGKKGLDIITSVVQEVFEERR